MCLCVFLAFGATLSADPYTFMPAAGISGLASSGYLGTGGYYDGVADSAIGPYAGTLTNNATKAVSPNSIYFCLTGNQYYQQPETGNDGPANVAQVASGATNNSLALGQQEEAAFLVSVMLTDQATDKVTLTTSGSGASEYLVASGTDVKDFEAALGPIQLAIWYVTQTLPNSLKTGSYNWNYTSALSITDSAVYNLVVAAQKAATNLWVDSNLQVFAYAQDSSGQNFISASVPEPSTMVLFGAGGLLMALGCGRKLLAKRRSR